MWLAVDGGAATRWAVSKAGRPLTDNWLAVGLGAERRIDRVILAWNRQRAAPTASRAPRMAGTGGTWRLDRARR
ncbi:hypothetical protein VT50_0208770 [Streptomyces antioxidans]|uniref:F5/8 type C domain-containing protein n=1 Tax=Streptomyces antioxidans TaxID=1507734 RepID=A0A1V4D8J4_9ACTN|nr:hypothetical protein VT50_0208770 [Streptomyces antioxidans]